MSRRNRRQSPRRLVSRAVGPVVEPLDARHLLAASVSGNGRTLHVVGTSGNDVITIATRMTPGASS